MATGSKILNVITSIRDSHPDMVSLYMYGQCYAFACILRTMFPGGQFWYSYEEGHMYYYLNSKWYDIRGVHYKQPPKSCLYSFKDGWPANRWGRMDRRRLRFPDTISSDLTLHFNLKEQEGMTVTTSFTISEIMDMPIVDVREVLLTYVDIQTPYDLVKAYNADKLGGMTKEDWRVISYRIGLSDADYIGLFDDVPVTVGDLLRMETNSNYRIKDMWSISH